MINFTFRKDTKNFNKSYKMGEPKKKKNLDTPSCA